MPQEVEQEGATTPVEEEDQEDQTPQCERCGSACDSDHGHNEHDDNHYCDECSTHLFTDCDRCGNTISRAEVIEALSSRGESQGICQDCRDDHYSRCNCGTVQHDDGMHGLSSGSSVCASCYEDDYFTCTGCDRTLHNDDYASDGECDSCHGSGGPIQDYGASPNLKPLGKGPHYYGVELEVECKGGDPGDLAQDVIDLLGDFAITKDDGSLDRGFEIVTRPASLEMQLKNWHKLFDDMPRGLKSFNTGTCGLHVHCSRKPLTALTIGRMLLFVNTREHHGFIERIAGRPFGKWGQYKDKGLKDGQRAPEERYEAINLMNAHTIEFRIFKGTLKEASVYKAIEFCDALIHFCQPRTENTEAEARDAAPGLPTWLTHASPYVHRDNKGTLLDQFCRFVEKRRKQWPHLWGFMSAKWLGRESKESKTYGYTVVVEEQ